MINKGIDAPKAQHADTTNNMAERQALAKFVR